MTPEDILNIPMLENNDAEASTIRDYFKKAITKLWCEDEGFSGKRPFGNSGWKNEIYTALVVAGIVEGRVYEENYVELQEVDKEAADELILAALEAL